MEGQEEDMSGGEEEGEDIVIEEEDVQAFSEVLHLCLIGRFLTDKSIHSKVMKERMANIWSTGRGVTIREVEQGLFLFQFYHKIDKERVVSSGQWNFDNHLLVVNEVHVGDIYNQIPLCFVDIWVQVHGLPASLMTRSVGQLLGNYIGVFVDYDANNNTRFWRSYMRIRVRTDVRLPLKKEHKVKKKGGEWCRVLFRYERMGMFCYLCGLLGHTDHFCEKLFSMDHDNGERGWGPELRAKKRRQMGGDGSRLLFGDGGTKVEMGMEGGNHTRADCDPNSIHNYDNYDNQVNFLCGSVSKFSSKSMVFPNNCIAFKENYSIKSTVLSAIKSHLANGREVVLHEVITWHDCEKGKDVIADSNFSITAIRLAMEVDTVPIYLVVSISIILGDRFNLPNDTFQLAKALSAARVKGKVINAIQHGEMSSNNDGDSFHVGNNCQILHIVPTNEAIDASYGDRRDEGVCVRGDTLMLEYNVSSNHFANSNHGYVKEYFLLVGPSI